MSDHHQPAHNPLLIAERVCYVAFAILSVIYNLTIPVFEASDESRHFAVIDYIRQTGRLPVQHPGEQSPWMQEGSQPPLYYALAIAATFWIDTSDLPQVLRYNPHAFIGLPEAQDNRNLVIHSDRESFPWRGTTLAIHVIRLLGAIMGVGTLLCVTAIAREVAPGREEVALGATALAAFTPMFLFVSASVNNDNLTILLGALALLLSLRLWRSGPSLRLAAALGLTIGADSLAKVGGLALVPLALAALGAAAWRDRRWREGLIAAVLILMLAIVTAGWWYLRNKLLYNEWLGLWTMSIQATQRPGAPVSLLELAPEWQGFRYSYWGVFGAFNIILPDWLYRVYDALLILATVGLVWEIAGRLRRPRPSSLGQAIETYGDLVPLALIALQIGATFAGIVRWTSLTKASQGRLMFPAMGGLDTLIVLGLTRWFYRGEHKERGDKTSFLSTSSVAPETGAVMILSLALFVVAALVPFTVIAPAYVPPRPVAGSDIPATARISPIRLGDQVELIGAQVTPDRLQPGEQLEVTVWWRALKPMSTDYVAFAKVFGRKHVNLAQVNRYPASGWVVTSQWRVGDIWRDTFRLRLPRNALAPAVASVEVGLYDVAAKADLRPVASDGTVLDRVVAGRASLAWRQPGLPASGTRFGDHILLQGFRFEPDPPTVVPGRAVTVTLDWSADGRPSQAYTVFVHLLGADETAITQADGQPLGTEYPTSFWDAGERVADPHILVIPPGTPSGEYRLRVGLYLLETGERLPVLDANGQVVSDHVDWPGRITITK